MRKLPKQFPLILAFVAAAASAQPEQTNRLPNERLNEQPTVQERIMEERALAEKAAQEVAAAEALEARAQTEAEADAEVEANDGSPPPSHANREAPVELITLVKREPEQFIGKDVVLDDGVNAVTVGPVLALRKRVADQEPYLIVDATSYFNAPTQYAIAVRDLDRIEDGLLVMPEADGMHLRGLDYYAEDYVKLETAEEVLAEQAEGIEVSEEAEEAETPGEIPLGRF